MPLSTILLIAVSFVIYRRARSLGRSGFLWAFLLWVIALGAGFVGACVSGVLIMLEPDLNMLSERELKDAIKGPVVIGMIIGAIITFWLCRRPIAKEAEMEDSAETGIAPGSPNTH